VQQANYIEAYPTPPPQVTTGYFPPGPAVQQSSTTHYNQTPVVAQQQNPQQQYPHANQQPQYVQYQGHAAQQFSPATQSNQVPISVQQQYTPQMQQQYPQQQQHNYTTPAVIANGTVHQYPQQTIQTLSPPPTPAVQSPSSHVSVPYNQPQNYSQTGMKSAGQFAPQQQGAASHYQPQAQPPQQANNSIQYQQQPKTFAQPSPPYQQQGSYPNQMQAQQPPQQNKRSSMMGGSLMGGGMMNKMSSKFTQMQKGVAGPPTAAHPNGKPADWKKWGKRAAIGVAGIGALALGVDAAGDMFSGAEGLAGGDWSGGGGDFSGGGGDFTGFEGSGDAAGVMDAQTAVDANYAQHAMEGIGQENSSMLLDPVGTECKF
jgi:hypothetical protein